MTQFAMPSPDLWKQVYAYLRRCGSSHHDAQDWTQNVFASLTAGGKISDNDSELLPIDEANPIGYVFTMARHEMINQYRLAQAHKRTRPNDDQTGHESPLPPDKELMQHETLGEWQSQVDQLGNEIETLEKKALYSDVRAWLFPGERSENLGEIACKTNHSLSATKVQIHRWRKQLIQRVREALNHQTAA